MDKEKRVDVPAILLFFAAIVAALFMVFWSKTGEVKSTIAGNINRIYLTLGEFELKDIPESPRGTEFLGSEMTFVSAGDTIFVPEVTLKGRGNSTWGQPKIPLTIKTADKMDFLGGAKSRKWTLLANYLDDSNLRNAVGLEVAKALEMPFSVNGDFVELYVNGEYEGLYYLTDKVEIAKGRVELDEPLGLLIERRTDVREDSGDVCYKTYNEPCFVVKDVVAEDNEELAAKEFVKQFKRFEKALAALDYEAIKAEIDTESVAKYYILSEVTVNPDAYITSEFFYKNGEKDVIHMGPGWDFDYALSNERWTWADDEEFYSSKSLNMNVPKDSFIAKLLEMPEFQAEVREVYLRTLGKRWKEVVAMIKQEAQRISLAALVNNVKWGLKDYNTESHRLTSWLLERLKYLDGVFNEVIE